MRMKALFCGFFLLGVILLSGCTKSEQKKPIRIIVPWAAGGETDQVVRVLAGELSQAWKQDVVVVNQPGGSGSIGTKSALEAPRDGYTWTSGAAKDLGTYIVTGKLDTKIQDWHLFLATMLVNVVSVHPDAPYKDFGEFLKAMKTNGNKVTVGTAGVNSAGHAAIEAIRLASGGTYRHVAYDGGNPAVLSTVKGETVATTQLIVAQTEMIRGKKLRPLAVLSDKPVTVKGHGEIPPITNWLPGFKATPIYFGLFLPKGVPDEMLKKLGEAWTTVIKHSKKLQDYCDQKGAVISVHSGDEAQKMAWPTIQVSAWLLSDGGHAKVSPDTLGIPRLQYKSEGSGGKE